MDEAAVKSTFSAFAVQVSILKKGDHITVQHLVQGG